MKLLNVINQMHSGEITKGVLNQRTNLSDEKTVTYWMFKCQKAGILISHICYGKGKVLSNWHCKNDLKIDLNSY